MRFIVINGVKREKRTRQNMIKKTRINDGDHDVIRDR